jgi:hypothetical protein
MPLHLSFLGGCIALPLSFLWKGYVAKICGKMRILFHMHGISLQKDIIIIPPVAGIDPFDFDLTPEKKKQLYDAGYTIAKEFIKGYHWPGDPGTVASPTGVRWSPSPQVID